MRKTLNLSKRIITSSVLNVSEIIKSYLTGELISTTPARFMNALLKGDYSFYRDDDEHYVYPIFRVDSEIRQSPLLNIRILILLRDAFQTGASDLERYVSVQSIYRYFDLMSVPEAAVEKSLVSLLESNLVEPYDLSVTDYSQSQRLAITHAGLANLELALHNPTYFEQMALTTRIVDADIATQIKANFHSREGLSKRMESVRHLFASYLVTEDGKHVGIPQTIEFAQQARLRNDVISHWVGAPVPVPSEEMPAEIRGVVGTVDSFDLERGFGFVKIPGNKDDAYLHIRVLEAAGFDEIHEDDELLCDISTNTKGLYVTKVHELATPEPKTYAATIVRVFEDRGYGFAHLKEIGIDAFFRFVSFSKEQRYLLTEGRSFSAEVRIDAEGRAQVKRVLSDLTIAG